jgi:hypothetical protein
MINNSVDFWNEQKGKKVRIKSCPSYWSSSAGGKYPLDLSYPVEGWVESSVKGKSSMFDGVSIRINNELYGFAISQTDIEILESRKEAKKQKYKVGEWIFDPEFGMTKIVEVDNKKREYKHNGWKDGDGNTFSSFFSFTSVIDNRSNILTVGNISKIVREKGFTAGNTFRDLVNKKEFEIDELGRIEFMSGHLYISVKKRSDLNNKVARIWQDGKWAKIILKKEAEAEAEAVYKVGDWVITKGYSDDYDGIPLKINKIFEGSGGNTYCNFDKPIKIKEGLYKPYHNFNIDDIERRVTKEEGSKTKEIKFDINSRVETPNGLGTVVGIINTTTDPFLVRHDNWNKGHDAETVNTYIKGGNETLVGSKKGYFYSKNDLKLLDPKKELIDYSDNPPEYVKIIKDGYSVFRKGDILRTEKFSKSGWRFVWDNNSGQIYEGHLRDFFESATRSEFEAFMLKKATEKYLLGTEYISVGKATKDDRATIVGRLQIIGEKDSIMITDGNGGAVYHKGKWAEIVQESVTEKEHPLIEEAKERGFKRGVRFYSMYDGGENQMISDNIEVKRNVVLVKCKNYFSEIYKQGQWAKIIEEPKKEPFLIEEAKRLGYVLGAKIKNDEGKRWEIVKNHESKDIEHIYHPFEDKLYVWCVIPMSPLKELVLIYNGDGWVKRIDIKYDNKVSERIERIRRNALGVHSFEKVTGGFTASQVFVDDLKKPQDGVQKFVIVHSKEQFNFVLDTIKKQNFDYPLESSRSHPIGVDLMTGEWSTLGSIKCAGPSKVQLKEFDQWIDDNKMRHKYFSYLLINMTPLRVDSPYKRYSDIMIPKPMFDDTVMATAYAMHSKTSEESVQSDLKTSESKIKRSKLTEEKVDVPIKIRKLKTKIKRSSINFKI